MFGGTSTFGSTNSSFNFAKPATSNPFGGGATPTFGAASTPATSQFGAMSTPAFGAASSFSPAFGSTTAPSSAPAFGFGAAKTNLFGANNAPSSFGFPSAPATSPATTSTFSFSNFGAKPLGQTSGVGVFGSNVGSTPIAGGTSAPAFSFNNPVQSGIGGGMFGQNASST
eukprot:CAMPEP_0175043338 /NCGR_PEP_ID=MMETSP0052_2-20121109/3119_1 /TAXON_ID=51329 ORGANISM="Polytomella parva, Strain SAG 63-3" /NCGR_SAMPLE_ID=MMETSP0052_2 /ASSEMBLY_ACC=CAM_ASM_000194 /LENGTH=169 /DNA_ID=CAMNT_0016306361 /DNA_START=24 /DNA_END=529 /DNA_ORIENTATION=-